MTTDESPITNQRYKSDAVRTTAKRVGGHWLLQGSKTVVLAGGDASRLLVSARLDTQKLIAFEKLFGDIDFHCERFIG